MKKYSYQEFAEEISIHFKNIPDAQVTVRTIKFWVKEGILPEPNGGGRWRYFEDDDLHEAVSIRKLQVVYGQSLEDIQNLNYLVAINPHTIQSGNTYNLSKLMSAIETYEKSGINPLYEIEAFKKHERLLVWDDAHLPPYRLIEEDQLSGSYFEEDGRVYRLLQFITDEDGKAIYFKPEQIEKYISLEIAKYIEFIKDIKRGEAKVKAQKIRALIDTGIMTPPRYRYKSADYFSESDIDTGKAWLSFIENYGLSFDDLKLFRKRIESDIENFFYAPEEGLFVESPIFYKFRKQVTLFNCCLDSFRHDLFVCEDTIVGHGKEDSLKLITDYLSGFRFLCYGFTGEICMKRTPIDRLSAEQIKTGLSEGKLTQREVKEILKAKKAEVAGLKSLVIQSLKGDGRGRKN